MQAIFYKNNAYDSYYGLKLLVVLVVLLLMLAYTSFYLIQNYYSKSFLEFNFAKKEVYFLKSMTTQRMYEHNGMDYEAYEKRLKYFEKIASQEGYTSHYVYSDELSKLKTNAKLIALDMMSLSKDEIKDTEAFVVRGGGLIYNFTSGFLDESLRYQKDNLVTRISDLHLDKAINTIQYDKNSTAYFSSKLLSPLTQYLPESKSLELSIYDPLPIFNVSKSITADAYLTNWSQSNYLHIVKNKELTQEQAGVLWHGYKGKGKWIYFSFPSYSMLENSQPEYTKLFKGMLEYLDKSIQIQSYPYVDAKNAIFVSEDTEYKFENLEQFYHVAEKNKFPVTAFCVANLAEKNKQLMAMVAKSKYVEIGSHSYTHKMISGESEDIIIKETKESRILLKTLTDQEVQGFRPPREELDETMLYWLDEGGFNYILGAGKNVLSPYLLGELLFIPRHGTDDYSYLINLDWDSKKILAEMKHQAHVLSALDGIYTLSTHTHLMSFSNNINIVDNFFQYINTQKDMTPMNGSMIYQRVLQHKKLSLNLVKSTKKVVLTLNNDNTEEVKNVHYRIYLDSDIVLKNIESEIIGAQTELTRISKNEYTLIAKSLKPKSQLVLFLNYDTID
jgi:peptidoglycan/xylan/chitin deacetylase (PgdA/CDA1 family)